MCTFMDAFDIMTTLSASFPSLSENLVSRLYPQFDFILQKYATQMPMHEIQNRIRTIKRNQYTCLSVCEKIRYTLSFAHILVLKNSIVSQSSDSSAARISPACKPSYEIRPSCSIPESIPTKESLHIYIFHNPSTPFQGKTPSTHDTSPPQQISLHST